MNDWYSRAENDLVEDLDAGLISEKDFREHIRDLNDALRAEAEEAAETAYNDVMGAW